MTEAELERAGGLWTAREISQQPSVWTEIGSRMARDSGELRAFLDPLLRRRELRIVLTGAGTSAFIGECLAPALIRRTGLCVDAVPTTDLVGSPDVALSLAMPTLLVSFARSGNSPESVAALRLAELVVPECHHLIFTCNRDGALYQAGASMKNARVVLLPEETNDRGFAMTSSYSGMLLAAALAFGLLGDDAPATLARWAGHVLDGGFPAIAKLGRSSFERVIFLGAREFKGLAREAALKMLELSDGRIVALADTPLGFRHGPKTIVNGKTLVVMFLANDPHARRYEEDLMRELRADGVAARLVAVTAADHQRPDHDGEISVPGATAASDLALCFPYAVLAQSLALLQSLRLGLRPDTPNGSGVVNRVVQGVSIHPWSPAR
jgi:tagatose-6-phosphate ketose/aldose isomerase